MAFTTLLLSVLLAVQAVVGLYPTTGANGPVYPRREIRDLSANYQRQYALFIQASRALQNLATSDLGSYYQISGIHGLPNANWDGVTGTGGGTGYCTHNMNIFPTWHRPYLALYEQQLSKYAKQIAATYTTNQQLWLDAANQLRLPYYDWIVAPAAGKSAYPQEIASTTVTIETPSGNQVVTNPIFSYKFPGTLPGSSPPFSNWPTTLRWPTSSASTASSNNAQGRSVIDSQRNSMRSGIYQMFVNCNNYALLSDQSQTRPNNCPTSLENFHGQYHVMIGGYNDPNGHMTQVPYAAFDPVFMLHHCQVDRLFALWQVLYPNSWVINQQAGYNTKTIKAGSTQGPTSPLTPFRNAAGQYWTSDTSRAVTKFNYTYPEVVAANGNAATMQQQINALYGPSATVTAQPGSPFLRRRAPLDARQVSDSAYEYNANIETSKFALGGSYVINMFLGNPSSADPMSWVNDPNLVGISAVFASSGLENDPLISSSTISLTSALDSKLPGGSRLANLPPNLVTPYLKKNLQWRVVKDGKAVDPTTIPNFKVSVLSSLRSTGSTNRGIGFPKWDRFQTIPEITHGKPGGLRA